MLQSDIKLKQKMRKIRIMRILRNGYRACINVDFCWKPETLEGIYNIFFDDYFTPTSFIDICSSEEETKLRRRLDLLRKSGWLKSKKKKVDGRDKRVYQLSKKALDYKEIWGRFDCKNGPLVTRAWSRKFKC